MRLAAILLSLLLLSPLKSWSNDIPEDPFFRDRTLNTLFIKYAIQTGEEVGVCGLMEYAEDTLLTWTRGDKKKASHYEKRMAWYSVAYASVVNDLYIKDPPERAAYDRWIVSIYPKIYQSFGFDDDDGVTDNDIFGMTKTVIRKHLASQKTKEAPILASKGGRRGDTKSRLMSFIGIPGQFREIGMWFWELHDKDDNRIITLGSGYEIDEQPSVSDCLAKAEEQEKEVTVTGIVRDYSDGSNGLISNTLTCRTQ
jgi:hypothetical protein